MLLLVGLDPADPRPPDHAHALGINGLHIQAAVLGRLIGDVDCVVSERVVTPDVLTVEYRLGVETLDFSGDLSPVLGGVELSDRPDPRAPVD